MRWGVGAFCVGSRRERRFFDFFLVVEAPEVEVEPDADEPDCGFEGRGLRARASERETERDKNNRVAARANDTVAMPLLAERIFILCRNSHNAQAAR